MATWAAVLLAAQDFLAEARGAQQAWATVTPLMYYGLGPVALLAGLLSWASYHWRTSRPLEAFRWGGLLRCAALLVVLVVMGSGMYCYCSPASQQGHS